MPDPAGLQNLLDRAASGGVAPALVLSLWRDGVEALCLAAGAARADTVFDLASLTKPLAGGLIAWDLRRRGLLDWDTPLADLLGPAAPPDKAVITVRQLLAHSAGYAPYRPFYTALANSPPVMRAGLLKAMLLNEPLQRQPGEAAVYSDLGYLLLGQALELAAGGELAMLLAQAQAELGVAGPVYAPLHQPVPWELSRVAPCGPLPGRPVVHGRVEDENAFALGGVAAHAGLFGSAAQCGGVMNALAGAPESEELFRLDAATPGSTRTPGFDTPSGPASAAGPNAPAGTVGHLGFTGVSLWWHRDTGSGVVLLTNRVALGRDNDKIKEFRPRLHQAAWEYLGF